MRRRLVSLAAQANNRQAKIGNQKSKIGNSQESVIKNQKSRKDTSAPRVPQPILQWRSGSPIGNVVREEFSEKQPGHQVRELTGETLGEVYAR
jgi:hypothetical protein